MKRLAPIGLVLVVVAVAGCGGGGKSSAKKQAAPAGGGGTGTTIQVKETEYHLAPSTIKIASTGTVTFDATNAGQTGHALELQGNGVNQKIGTISPGSSGKLTVTLSKKGTYQLFCPIDNHRAMGMQATVVVGGGSATTPPPPATTTTGSTSTSSGYGY
jgi:plastocyanin